MTTRKWGNEFIVNTTTAGQQDQSAVTALADGGFMVAWRDDGITDSTIRLQRYDAQGNAVGGEINIADAADYGGTSRRPASCSWRMAICSSRKRTTSVRPT